MEEKSILILSQEPWSFLFLSKQNYAVAFAEKGYKVFYCSFPQPSMGWGFKMTAVPNHPNIHLVDYSIPAPYYFRFRVKWIYRWINKLFFKHYFINKQKQLTLCIDFGLYHYLYTDMLWTNAEKNIFFPADNSELLPAEYKGADAIFSVSHLILDRYKKGTTRTHLINHGLATPFVIQAEKKLKELDNTEEQATNSTKSIGYIGNLNIHLLDKDLLIKIIENLPDTSFYFYGKLEKSIDPQFYERLLSFSNVYYKGQKNTEELSAEMQKMDAFFMCYTKECNEEISGNSHKIMEYLSTGKVLFTTFIEILADKPFIAMTAKDKRDGFIDSIKNGMQQLDKWNSKAMQKERINFALENTYQRNIQKMEQLLNIA